MKLPRTIFFLLAFVTSIQALSLPASLHDLYKRNGGGGGHGGGSEGGGYGSSSSGGKGSSSSAGGSSSGGSGRGSSPSNTGGRTTSSRGVRASYSGGRFYGGDAAVPYTSGMRSSGGISPYLLAGGTLGFVGGGWVRACMGLGPTRTDILTSTTTTPRTGTKLSLWNVCVRNTRRVGVIAIMIRVM